MKDIMSIKKNVWNRNQQLMGRLALQLCQAC